MYIYLSQLVEALRKVFQVTVYNIVPQYAVTGIELMPEDPGDQPPDPEIIYICEYRQLLHKSPDMELRPFICIVPHGSSVETAFFANKAAILIDSVSTAQTMLGLSNAFYSCGQHSSQAAESTKRLLSCRSVQELLDTGRKLLDCPMIVTDANQTVLCYNRPEDVNEPLFDAITAGQQLPTGHMNIEYLSESSSLEQLPYTYFETEDPRDVLCGIICKALIFGRSVVGYLHILLFDRKLTNDETGLVDFIGNILSVRLQQENRHGVQNSEQQAIHFIRDILENVSGDENYMRLRRQTLDRQLRQNLYVIVIYGRRETVPEPQTNDGLTREIAGLLPGAYSFLFRNSIFTLWSCDLPHPEAAARLEALTPLLEAHNLIAGVGNFFHAVDDIRRYGFQARKAVQFGSVFDPQRSLFHYQDYAVYYIAELCSRTHPIQVFCPPGFAELLRAEENSSIGLLDTLRMYLKCGRGKTLTAEKLFIHISTLKYRLAKIQSILAMDIDRDDNALSLMLAVRMWDYQCSFRACGPQGIMPF